MSNVPMRRSLRGNMQNAHSGKTKPGPGDGPKSNKKKQFPKRNVTKPTKMTPSKAAAADDNGETGDDEADEADSNADGEDGHDLDQTDVLALSSVPRTANEAKPHLAGLTYDDMILSDTERANGGASDEEYGAIEELSDSEDSIAGSDEKRILRSTEQELIKEFEFEHEPRAMAGVNGLGKDTELSDHAALARRLSLQSEDSQLDDLETELDLDFSMDPFGGLAKTDNNYKELLQDAEQLFGHDNLGSWRHTDTSLLRENSITSNIQKKVRFEATPSRTSSMSSEEDPRDTFPDLFAETDDSLHPQPLLANGMDYDMMGNLENESVYDFDDEYAVAGVDGDDSDYDSVSSDSESESDDGETTDEETMDEQVARMAAIRKAAGKGPPSTPNSTPVTTGSTERPSSLNRKVVAARVTTPRSGKDLPKAGTFAHDPTKAIVTADRSGNGIKLICPTNPPANDRAYWDRARQVLGSRDGSPHGPVSWTKRITRAPALQRPLTARSTLGTMFNGNLDFLRDNDHAGIANALSERPAPGKVTLSSFGSATFTETETSDDESPVNIEDFLELEDSDSEMEDPSPAAIMSPTESELTLTEWNMEASPMLRQDSASSGLLDHFDQQRGLVASFRNNQHHARHFSSLPSHPARRAQMSESNALQKGRRSAANTPMTPARKKRISQDMTLTGSGVKKAVASPLAARHRRRSRGSSLSGIYQTLALDRFGPPLDDQHDSHE